MMENIFEKLNRYFYRQWRLAVLDKDIGRWQVATQASNISYLKAENANGRHILIQPDSSVEDYYMLVDDVSWPVICHQHHNRFGQWKPGRMVVETSRNNYQVWIHSSRKLSLSEKRYWLKKLHSDPGADPNNRWGRCPGFRNRKEKHRNVEGGYPLSRLIWLDWRGLADIPTVGSLEKTYNNLGFQPYYSPLGKKRQIYRSDYDRGDESATDFAYALALLRRGNSSSVVMKRILSERRNWKNHQGEKRIRYYLERTLRRAQDTISRSDMKI